MAIGVGNLVSAADYNAIYNKINKVLGDDGSNVQVGYGRALASSAVTSGDVIDSTLLDNLYADLVKARTHQRGTTFTWDTPPDGINAPDTGEYIGAFAADIGATNSSDATTDENEGFLDFSQAAQDIDDDKYDLGSDQSSIQLAHSASRTTSWNGTIIHEVDLVFANANERRYFFNSQGLAIFNAGLTGGNSVAGDQTQTYPNSPAYQKDEIWQTMLNNMGTIYFGSNSTSPTGTGTGTAIGNYQLTSSFQTVFTKSGSGVYSENFYKIEAKGAQTSNTITFKITFADEDVGDNRDADAGFPGEGTPVDENVTGDITSTIQTRAATGVLGINHPGASAVSVLGGGGLVDSYVLTASSTSITEGDTVTISLQTSNIPNGSVAYTISGGGGGLTFGGGSGSSDFTAADLSSGSITGSFNLVGGFASLDFTLADDGVSENTETMTLSLDNGRATIDINVADTGVVVPTYSITNPSPNVIAEGDTGVFAVSTTNVPNGTVLYWTISHLTTSDADFDAVQGTITINNNAGSIGVTTTADLTTEGQETFILRLREGSYAGTIVASGGSGTTVGDTSTTPPPVTLPGNMRVSAFSSSLSGDCEAVVNVESGGTITSTGSSGFAGGVVVSNVPYTWLQTGVASDYECKWDYSEGFEGGGQISQDAGQNVWLNMGTTRSWAVFDTSNLPGLNEMIGTFSIREAGTTNVLATTTLYLQADQDP
mgnify:CR=1 FL=1